MSIKGAWGRPGGAAKLFEKERLKARARPNIEAPVPVHVTSEVDPPENLIKIQSDPASELAVNSEGTINADDLAHFFASERTQFARSGAPAGKAQWVTYIRNIWSRLTSRGNCPAHLRSTTVKLFEEIVGWENGKFNPRQEISPRQLEILFRVLLNHLAVVDSYVAAHVPVDDGSLRGAAVPRRDVSTGAGSEFEARATTAAANTQTSKTGPQKKPESGNQRGRRGRKGLASKSTAESHENKGQQKPHQQQPGGKAEADLLLQQEQQEQLTGRVTRWGHQGFGFIKPDDGGEDLHVSQSDIVGDFNALIIGGRVFFTKRYNERARKYKACRVSGEACTVSTAPRNHGGNNNNRRRRGRRSHNNGGNSNGGRNMNYPTPNSGPGGTMGYAPGAIGFGGVPFGNVGPGYGGVPYPGYGGGFQYSGYGGQVHIPIPQSNTAPGYGDYAPGYGYSGSTSPLANDGSNTAEPSDDTA